MHDYSVSGNCSLSINCVLMCVRVVVTLRAVNSVMVGALGGGAAPTGVTVLSKALIL